MTQPLIDGSQIDGSSLSSVDASTLSGQSIGTGANDILALNGSSQIPAVDGSLLTDVVAADGVTTIGTPADNQVGVWTGDGTQEGTTGLIYSGSLLDITGAVDASVEYLFTERAAHAFTPIATRGILWVRSDSPNKIIFTDDAGTDFDLTDTGGSGDVGLSGTPVDNQLAVWTGAAIIEGTTGLIYSGSLLDITGSVDASVEFLFTERADHNFTPDAARGILWVRSDSPNKLIFTDDAGTDFDLTDTGGSGDVGVSGTPVDNQLAVWTGAAVIEGTTGLAYSGTLLDVTGAIDASVEYLFTERADHNFTPDAARGILWVRSDSPNMLVFTDDAGTDFDLNVVAGIGEVQDDTSPLLGGDLDVNGNTIISISNGDIDIIPNGTGKTKITNIEAPTTINIQSGTTYTAVLADADKMITLDNGAGITMTIPANSSVAYPVGTKLNFLQLGDGQVTVDITTDTLDVEATFTLLLAGKFASATAFKITTTTWVLFGNLEAV